MGKSTGPAVQSQSGAMAIDDLPIIRSPVALSAVIRAMSIADKLKSMMLKLDAILAGLVDIVFNETPFCKIQRRATCAADLP